MEEHGQAESLKGRTEESDLQGQDRMLCHWLRMLSEYASLYPHDVRSAWEMSGAIAPCSAVSALLCRQKISSFTAMRRLIVNRSVLKVIVVAKLER